MSAPVAEGTGKQFRRLLPASASAKRVNLETKVPKLKTVVAACNTCRKHKTKCSGERPSCHRCFTRGYLCQYSTEEGESPQHALLRNYRVLRDEAASNREMIELLKSLPEKDAQYVLQRIRLGTRVTTILNHVKAGDLLLQMATVPETRLRYEFPYHSEMPADFIPNNPYLNSLIYEAASLYSDSSDFPGRQLTAEQSLDERSSIYLKPFHAAHIVEPLLTDVKISWWTTVCDDDVLMRDLISVFLRCEYHFTAAFQKDLLLQDMASRRQDFCSPLLVNIILAYSCVCYPRFAERAEYWNPRTLLYRFVAEAKRLWELEAQTPRVTTIQAGVLFNVFHNLCGLDEIGQKYRIQALALAQKLGLFDSVADGTSERIRHGQAFAAWALYSWETLVAFSFMLRPLLDKPPDVPLPDPSTNIYWYGEIWLKYPLSQGISPSYFGQIFETRCRFRIIMNEFCQSAYSEGSSMTIDKTSELHLRLRSWYDELPEPLSPRNIALPAHLQLHMYFHHLMLTMYEPLLNTQTNAEMSPKQTIHEARTYLQTLVRLYYLRHGFETMDLFIVIPLMLTGVDCIEEINDETPLARLEVLRSTLILVAQGLYNQRRNHYLAEALFRVIRGRMRPQEVALLREAVHLDQVDTEERRGPMQTVRSHWPVSVVKNMDEMHSNFLTNLVENYAHLNVEEMPQATSESS